jgi:hypothetical protein
MKLKYKVAVKYYNETKNHEQLEFAYKEIENFTETYSNFKWYYKFNFEKIKNCYEGRKYNKDNLDLDCEIQQVLFSENISRIQFFSFMERYKYKIVDAIFQSGNYNVDLVKYAIENVIDKEKTELDINSILKNEKFNPGKHTARSQNELSNYSMVFSFSMVIFSIILIFVHYYMFMKYPHKFFKEFQG